MEEKNIDLYTTAESDRTLTVLVGILMPGESESENERSLAELTRLVDTAGGEVVATMTQAREKPDVRTCLGSGKLLELKEVCTANDVNMVVFDCELTPSQIKNIENELENVDVIDRSMLILDIFAQHATTSEGRLQIDIAQLKYTAPRLAGKGKDMSRLGAGIHTRGPGESKLEADRRRLRTRIVALEKELEKLDAARMTQRAARDRSGIPKVAIVGYTNAGKSTLLNRLTDAGILAEDKLFATLDPTTRKFTLPGGSDVLLTDTVGFIRRLPHHLIKAFKSTLDEAVFADVLMIIADISDEECGEHLQVTDALLTELGAADKPRLYVFNKCDRGIPEELMEYKPEGDTVFVSALTGKGMEELTQKLEEMIRRGKTVEKFVIPNAEQGAMSVLYSQAEVVDVDYGPEAVIATAVVDAKVKGMMKKYLQNV